MSDLDLVRRCVDGQAPAWDEFLEKYSRLIYNYIHSSLSYKSPSLALVHADDIFQEIFYSLSRDNFKNLKSFKAKNGCSLASWLRQVTINASLSYVRKIKFDVSLDEENPEGLGLKDVIPSAIPGAASAAELSQEIAQLKGCIGVLNSDDKYFLELHINQGIKLQDLLGHFKLSRAAIDMQKSRIVNRLKDCFKKRGFALDF